MSMLISLVSKSIDATINITKKSGTKRIKILEAIDIKPKHNSSGLPSSANIEKYCNKLKDAIGKDISKDESTDWNICTHFLWRPTFPKRTWIYLHGSFLQKLLEICGNNISLCIETTFRLNRKDKLSSMEMSIDSVTQESGSSSPVGRIKFSCDDISKGEASCDDLICQPSDDTLQVWRSSTTNTALELNIWIVVRDEYINNETIGLRKLQNLCKSILNEKINSDISIVVDGKTFPANKCFLAAHSSVLKTMMESNFKESETNIIEITDVSQTSIEDMLSFVYTWEMPESVNDSKTAADLFQFAHKYDVTLLEEELSNLLMQRSSNWYDVEVAINLFAFVRNVEEHADLKTRMINVLKTKRNLLKVEGFKMLFQNDMNAAMELCSMALELEEQ